MEGGSQLGQWVHNIRMRSTQLDADQTARLKQLGFIWDMHADAFERNYALLAQFVAREGHARVPASHVEDGVPLGRRVIEVRTTRAKLSPERIARLEQLGFIWNTYTEEFERNYALLAQFFRKEGHSQVPRDYVIGTVRLGEWVKRLRSRKIELTDARRKRLQELNFSWK
jgi:hypothetical protein